jgi:hypothetical protein
MILANAVIEAPETPGILMEDWPSGVQNGVWTCGVQFLVELGKVGILRDGVQNCLRLILR